MGRCDPIVRYGALLWGAMGRYGALWGSMGRYGVAVPLLTFRSQYAPTEAAMLEIRSRRIEIYSARLRLHARLSGIRYVLYHFPLTSAMLGIATNFTVMAAIVLLSCIRGGALWPQPQPVPIRRLQRAPVRLVPPLSPRGKQRTSGSRMGTRRGRRGMSLKKTPLLWGSPIAPMTSPMTSHPMTSLVTSPLLMMSQLMTSSRPLMTSQPCQPPPPSGSAPHVPIPDPTTSTFRTIKPHRCVGQRGRGGGGGGGRGRQA
uniref:Seipin n=1 Tax=Coturnix japonica TaxID=93934 RepID=A0A8C2T1D0_COTJA